MQYSQEVTEDAEKHPTLGAEYFEARNVMQRFMQNWTDEHAKEMCDAILKPVLDTIRDKVWDAFRDSLLSDTEYNAAGAMRDMVKKSVEALIGGQKWANVKYIQGPYSDGQKVRETLAKLYSDEIKDGRIADLEKKVEQLTKDINFYRNSR